MTLLLLTSLFITGCQKASGFKTEEKGIEIELLNINTKKNEKTGSTVIQLDTRLTNRSDKKITSIKYELQLYDEKDELIKSYSHTYYGEDKSLDPGSSVDDYYGFQDKLERDPKTFKLAILETKDIDELPLIHLPLPDEYLYEAIGLNNIKENLPVKIVFRIDRMGAQDIATIEDEETIRKAIEYFCIIKIDKESGVFVTDNYNSVSFYFNDGSEKHINFNLYNLEIHTYTGEHTYELKDLEAFWSFCASLASPDNY